MVFESAEPLGSYGAQSAAYGTARELQTKIKRDLISARSDDVIERPVLGWVVCLLALAKYVGYAPIGKQDAIEWKSWYLEWFDINEKRFPKRFRQAMRTHAEELFNDLIRHGSSEVNLKGTQWDVIV